MTRNLSRLAQEILTTCWGRFDLIISSPVRSDMELKGAVLINKKAIYRGKITAHYIEVEGSVIGDLSSDFKIIINEGASINGKISAPSIVISEGATIDGRAVIEKQGSDNVHEGFLSAQLNYN